MDYSKLTTERLLEFKKKKFPYEYACCYYNWKDSSDCPYCDDIKRCQSYWNEYQNIKNELNNREHITKKRN